MTIIDPIIIFGANIVVGAVVGSFCLFAPKKAVTSIFNDAFSYSEIIRLAGAFWIALGVLSFFGLFYPVRFSPILFFQLVYKPLWLLVYALPHAIKRDFTHIPWIMTAFFLLWVILLPFAIPFDYLFG